MNRKINAPASAVLILLMLTFSLFQACKKSVSDLAENVAKATGNKEFGKLNDDTLALRLKAAIQLQSVNMDNPAFTRSMYEKNGFTPILITRFLKDSSLVRAAAKIHASEEHGISQANFNSARLDALLKKLYTKSAVSSLDDAYNTLINLEITAGIALDRYSRTMQYGLVSPRRVFAQFYTKITRPDSLSFLKPFQTAELRAFLDSIQPKSDEYRLMQQALNQKITAPGRSQEETRRILCVNLERLRWQNGKQEDKYVWVNIPAFQLLVIEKGKAPLSMKVCVGEGRNASLVNALEEYEDSDVEKDRPFNRETPQLKSSIHSVQVNPVWNIPQSIATNEITKYATHDKYYLSNNNIDVFLNGKKIDDPETIDFSKPGAGKTYTFKQRPGAENSLGKIKFLFDNQSSVYLHDTPAKDAFKLSQRAISHGCVRVEQPLELAKALFGEGEAFTKIKTGMTSKNPKAENISLKKQVPVYLSYFTCWTDIDGKLKFAKDVYGQDAVLYTHLIRG